MAIAVVFVLGVCVGVGLTLLELAREIADASQD